MIVAAALVLLAGFLVGATTLGGLIVVPALTEFAKLDIDGAVAATSAAMTAPAWLATGAAWTDKAHRPAVITVAAGSGAGAAAGAASLAVLPASVTIALLALLALAGGLRGLAKDRWTAQPARPASIPIVAVLATIAGVLSAITGTGGPIALWPLLGLAAQPVALCWIAALAVQLPVAIGATAANAFAGRLDLGLTAGLAVLLVAGFLLGRRVTARASAAWLGRAASLMLLAIATWLVWILVR